MLPYKGMRFNSGNLGMGIKRVKWVIKKIGRICFEGWEGKMGKNEGQRGKLKDNCERENELKSELPSNVCHYNT